MNTDSIDSKIEEIRLLAAEKLTDKRLRHTKGVVKMAKELAKRYGADVKKAELAALCHDLYRKVDAGGLAQAVRELGIDEKYAGNINLAHGKVAAAAMKRDFGIDDEDVLNAVSFHTTGRAGMSLLEKIIYVADGAEENRDYPGVERVRKAAFEDIDKACLMMMENTIEYVKGQGQNLDEETLSAAEYFRKILNTEEHMNSREQAMLAAKVLDSKKAQNIVIIDIAEKSSFADYLVIAGGGSERQTLALTDDVEDAMAKEGFFPKGIEGKNSPGWILMDFGDIIVNILTKESREKYDIEKVWGDCAFVDMED